MASLSESDILARVAAVLKETLRTGDVVISPTTRFAEDLKADSVDRMALLMALEEEFATTIDDEQARGFATVGDVLAYVGERSAQADPS